MTWAQEQATATRVLLVEDNPGDADLVRLSLEDAGAGAFELEAVARLSDALTRIPCPPALDIVLLDLTLPDAFGLEGLRKLKEAAPEIPVVVFTGSDRSLGAAAIQAGAQDYLLKGAADAPFVPRALRYAIERQQHAGRAQFLAAERAARAAAEAARERMSLLAAASLSVSHSLEDRHALASLASAVVPRLADWCAIRIMDTDGGVPRCVSVCHGGAGSAALEAGLEAAVAGEAAYAPGPAAVAASARSELYQDVRADSVPPAWRAALAELGAQSAMVVPIQLNEEVLGAIVFAALNRRFVPDDLALAEEIGRRAGVAIANCRLYREARLAVAARDEFLSAAAHELRTPVTVLQLKLEQVALKQQASICGTCDRAVPVDYVGASRQISRLGQLVESLLDLSRIDTGRTNLKYEEIDLRDVARDAIARLAELASRGGFEIVLHCAEPVRGTWDRLALERVLVNLLSNALKFGVGKPVEVRVRAEGAQVVIEVEDHGIGIVPEDLDRIFVQFERAVSSRHFGGLGLGLYITRRLVEQHGGTVTAASQPGSGSVFTVRVPRAGALPAAVART